MSDNKYDRIETVRKALTNGIITPDRAEELIRSILHFDTLANDANGILGPPVPYQGSWQTFPIVPQLNPVDKSSIKDPDIDEHGEFKKKPRRDAKNQILCDSGWDWGFEEAMEYAKRPIKWENAV